jgi:hypothetical protein
MDKKELVASFLATGRGHVVAFSIVVPFFVVACSDECDVNDL